MEVQSNNPGYALEATINAVDYFPKSLSREDIMAAFERLGEFAKLFQQSGRHTLSDLVTRFASSSGKKSFLVFSHNKYFNVATQDVAFFYIKYESPVIVCFDKQEFFVNYSLEQIQNLLPAKQFFRLNRQYLINFNAVKDVEHYFARKLLVNPVIPARDKLLVSKEKVSEFLGWLDNR